MGTFKISVVAFSRPPLLRGTTGPRTGGPRPFTARPSTRAPFPVHTMGTAILPTGPEPEEVDVTQFYVPSEELMELDDPQVEAAALHTQLDSDVWTVACGGLLVARRLAVHHTEVLRPVLHTVIPKLRTSMNSLRSSLCKTALLTCQDFFKTFGNELFVFLDEGDPSVLHTLLHKAALDKPFIIAEAKRTLQVMIDNLDVNDLVANFFLARVDSKNDKVRAVVSECIRNATEAAWKLHRNSDSEDSYHENCVFIERIPLLKAASVFVNDRQPSARENARLLLQLLKTSHAEMEAEIGDANTENTEENIEEVKDEDTDSWTKHVEKALGKPTAVKICKLC